MGCLFQPNMPGPTGLFPCVQICLCTWIMSRATILCPLPLVTAARINGEGNGTPLQYSCLENPMNRGAWWAAVHGVSKSRTQLSDFTFTFHFHALEKETSTPPLQFSCMENPRDGRAWWAAIYGVTLSRTRLKRQQQKRQLE